MSEVDDFLDALEPGGVGCVSTDIVEGTITIPRGGTPEEKLTITGIGVDPPTIAASVVVPEAASEVILRNLTIIAPPSGDDPAVTVLGSNVSILDSDISNRGSGPCIAVGEAGTVTAETEIARNRIHDCGDKSQPPEGAVHLRHADRTLLEHNLVYENPAAGVSLYPRAAFSRIFHNTIVSNGVGIYVGGGLVCPEGSGAACLTSTRRTALISSKNHIAFNVIGLSRQSPTSLGVNVVFSFPTPAGVPNFVRSNCLWGDRPIRGLDGVEDANEVSKDDSFRDASGGDFRVAGAPPCSERGAKQAVLGDR